VSSQSVADGGVGNFTFNNTPVEVQTAQVNCYYHANFVRDLVLSANANYPTISTQTSWPIFTNIADSCNAYYDGSSINFFTAGGGCNNTGFSSVVHHEYGHHVVNVAGSGQAQYGEGMSDVLAVLMGDEPQLGVGFFSGNCSNGIRNASNNCVGSTSGSTCGSGIHAWGQVLSGSVWDLRNSFAATYPTTYRSKLANLAINAVPLHAGQSDIGPDITADYLTLDDAVSNGGNGVIADGTPNYNAISQAFNRHGLTSPSIALLLIEFPNALPTSIDPSGSQTFDLTIRPVSSQILANSQKMFFRGFASLNAGLDLLLDLGMDKAELIVFTGGSAGGLTVFLHLDHVRERMRTQAPNARVVGEPVCGFFLDSGNDGYAPANVTYTQQMAYVFKMQNAAASLARVLSTPRAYARHPPHWSSQPATARSSCPRTCTRRFRRLRAAARPARPTASARPRPSRSRRTLPLAPAASRT
jgi:hypothetical protein